MSCPTDSQQQPAQGALSPACAHTPRAAGPPPALLREDGAPTPLPTDCRGFASCENFQPWEFWLPGLGIWPGGQFSSETHHSLRAPACSGVPEQFSKITQIQCLCEMREENSQPLLLVHPENPKHLFIPFRKMSVNYYFQGKFIYYKINHTWILFVCRSKSWNVIWNQPKVESKRIHHTQEMKKKWNKNSSQLECNTGIFSPWNSPLLSLRKYFIRSFKLY